MSASILFLSIENAWLSRQATYFYLFISCSFCFQDCRAACQPCSSWNLLLLHLLLWSATLYVKSCLSEEQEAHFNSRAFQHCKNLLVTLWVSENVLSLSQNLSACHWIVLSFSVHTEVCHWQVTPWTSSAMQLSTQMVCTPRSSANASSVMWSTWECSDSQSLWILLSVQIQKSCLPTHNTFK